MADQDQWTEEPLIDLLISMESGSRPKGGVRGSVDGIPSLGGEHLTSDGGFDFRSIKFVPKSFYKSMRRGRIEKGDVLIVKDGATTGKVSLVGDDFPFDDVAANEHLFVCRPAIEPEYLFRFLHSAEGQRRILEHFRGSAQGGITREFADLTMVPVAPPEQRKVIVEALGVLNDRSQATESHFSVSSARMITLRQTLLSAACSGRLTEDWRLRNPDEPSVEDALVDLLSSRKPKKQTEKPVDLVLPDVPSSYLVSTVGDASLSIEYGTSKKCGPDPALGIPVLRMGNIQDGSLDFEELKYCPLDPDVERLLLTNGDLLFNRTNSPELVGKSAVFHGDETMSFASYLIRVRFGPEVANPDFVNLWINSAWGRAWAQLAKTDGVSQSNINGSRLALMPLPLPPIREQHEIIRRVSAAMDKANDVSRHIDTAAKRNRAMVESVLSRTFTAGGVT